MEFEAEDIAKYFFFFFEDDARCVDIATLRRRNVL